MKTWMRGLVAVVSAAAMLSGCGSDSDSSSVPVPPPGGSVAAAISTAAANPANDTSTNSSSAFSVLQANGVPAVVVRGAPVVNFTVFSNGAVKQGLRLTDMSFAIAKLVPASNGNPARWQSYVSRIERTTGANAVGSGPGGTPVLAEALQATTDPKPAAQANQLVYNAEGYYTYTFSTNITDPANTSRRGVRTGAHAPHRDPAELHERGGPGGARQSVLRRHVRRQRQLGRCHRPGQDADHCGGRSAAMAATRSSRCTAAAAWTCSTA